MKRNHTQLRYWAKPLMKNAHIQQVLTGLTHHLRCISPPFCQPSGTRTANQFIGMLTCSFWTSEIHDFNCRLSLSVLSELMFEAAETKTDWDQVIYQVASKGL